MATLEYDSGGGGGTTPPPTTKTAPPTPTSAPPPPAGYTPAPVTPQTPPSGKIDPKLAQQLAKLRYNFPFDISKYVDQALLSTNDIGTALDIAYASILKGPEFNHYYPGIFNAKGELRLTPAQYDQYVTQASHLAALQGFNVTRAQIGSNIGRDVSLDEFKFKVDAAAQVKANAGFIPAMNEIFKAAGLPQIHSAQDAFNFYTGIADRKAYDVYEQASIIESAKAAGLNVGYNEARSLSTAVPGATPFADYEKGFKNIADQLRLAGPEISSFGLSQRDLETIEFGGPGRAELAAKAEQALKQRQAALSQPQAQTPVRLSGSGQPTIVGYEKQPGL